ncbi:MAG: hypothetical protein LUC38_02365 [Oscillospiraceae bacterium]|nr:hypothetical protein [Oscillospiraceae bacterium]
MEFDADLYLLSPKFTEDYPPERFPELMHKHGRPYTCLLIDTHDDYFICVPFRSDIHHKNAFLFTNTERSKRSRSGLDFSKIVIIKDTSYFDDENAIVDQDEYAEMKRNLPTIVESAVSYVDAYINHVTGKKPLHPREFARRYQFSTLPYFHDIMGI